MSKPYPIDYFVTIHGHKQTKRVHITARTKSEEATKLAEWQRKLDAGDHGGSNLTVREWSEKWLEAEVKPRALTTKSYKAYPGFLEKWILPIIGDIKLRHLTANDCKTVIAQMGRLSKSYQRQCIGVMRQMLGSAYDDERLPRDPTTKLRPTSTAKPAKERLALTDAERAALETVCLQPTLADGRPNDSGAIYLTMLYCGLRPGEICTLKKSDIDFVKLEIHVRTARERGTKTVKEPKTAAGTRVVPMTQEFAQWLQGWLAAHPTKCALAFTQRDRETMLTDSSLNRRWQTYRKHIARELGAQKIETKPGRKKSVTYDQSAVTFIPYNCRHTYATELVLAGVDRWTLALFMGHSDPSVTDKYYVHVGTRKVEEARTKMELYRQSHPGGIDPRDIARWGMGQSSTDRFFKLALQDSARKTQAILGDAWSEAEFEEFARGCLHVGKKDELGPVFAKYLAALNAYDLQYLKETIAKLKEEGGG